MRLSREDLITELSLLIRACTESDDSEEQESFFIQIAEAIEDYHRNKLESKKDRIAMQDYFNEILR